MLRGLGSLDLFFHSGSIISIALSNALLVDGFSLQAVWRVVGVQAGTGATRRGTYSILTFWIFFFPGIEYSEGIVRLVYTIQAFQCFVFPEREGAKARKG